MYIHTRYIFPEFKKNHNNFLCTIAGGVVYFKKCVPKEIELIMNPGNCSLNIKASNNLDQY